MALCCGDVARLVRACLRGAVATMPINRCSAISCIERSWHDTIFSRRCCDTAYIDNVALENESNKIPQLQAATLKLLSIIG